MVELAGALDAVGGALLMVEVRGDTVRIVDGHPVVRQVGHRHVQGHLGGVPLLLEAVVLLQDGRRLHHARDDGQWSRWLRRRLGRRREAWYHTFRRLRVLPGMVQDPDRVVPDDEGLRPILAGPGRHVSGAALRTQAWGWRGNRRLSLDLLDLLFHRPVAILFQGDGHDHAVVVRHGEHQAVGDPRGSGGG